jgi:hypothetical protein
LAYQTEFAEYIIFTVDLSHPLKPKVPRRILGFFIPSSSPQEISAHDESHRQARLAMVQQCNSFNIAHANRLCPRTVAAS